LCEFISIERKWLGMLFTLKYIKADF